MASKPTGLLLQSWMLFIFLSFLYNFIPDLAKS
jgi:hypothetical protein